MKKRITLLLVALALLATLAFNLYAAPATDPAVLNQVNAAAVEMDFTNYDGTTRLTCPYCNALTKWTALPAATSAKGLSGHYYLAEDRTSNTSYYIPAGNVCLHLNGHDITTTNYYAIAGKVGYEFNVMGEGNVTAKGSTDLGAVYGAGTVRLFGGTYAATGTKSYVVSVVDDANVYMYNGATINGNAGAGGAVINAKNATYHLYGGTINANGGTGLYLTAGTTNLAGVTVNAGSSSIGVYLPSGNATVVHSAGSVINATRSNVYVGAGSYTLSDSGSITGGSTTIDNNAGNVVVTGTGAFTMTGGEISGGSSVSGGNVHIYKGSFTMEGGTISGGTATGNGGNVYVNTGTASLTVKGGTITGGTALNGGNVYVYGGTLNMENGTITEGQAIGNYSAGQYYYYGGGNIYVNNSASAVANISGGTVSDGTATNNSGGNILCHTNGTLTVSGGTISGGTAGALGGNIMNGASAKVTISGGTISGGKSAARENANGAHKTGDNVASFSGTLTVSGGTIESSGKRVGEGILACYNATLILDGNAKITNAGKTGNIFVSTHLGGAPKLQVKSTFTGEAGVQWNTVYGYGDTVASTEAVCDGAYTGKLYYESQSAKPGTLALNGSLVIGAAQLVGKDGTAVWYANNADALAAYANTTEYLMTVANELTLPDGNYTVDLAGKDMTFTGTGNVTCFDSANDDYTANGSATIAGQVALVNDAMIEVNGKQYVKLGADDLYTFHRLDMRVNGMSFRPSTVGIYYTCIWNCDDTLKSALDKFGVALSTAAMPVDEASLETCMYTEESMNDFGSGVIKNSVLLQNIFSEEAWDKEPNNSQRGKAPIFAAPYVYLNNNGDCEYLFLGGVSKSLYDVMTALDADEYYDANTAALEDFYETWGDAMTDWGFQNIGQPWGTNPEEDGKLQLFMMGNSFTYYYVEELYGLLAEAGYENAEIYNLYYSGSDVKNHYDWWINGEAKYQFFKTDSTGRKELTPSSGTRWTLEQGLAVGNWDYIGIQPSTTSLNISFNNAIGKDDAEMADHMAPAIACVEPLLYRIHNIFPDAQILWQRSWAPEIGRVSGSTVYNEEKIALYDAGLQRIQDYWCNVYDQDKPFDLKMVNSGAAWTEARALNAELETSLIPEVGGLCARWGVVNTTTYPLGEGYENPGDGYHDGDIGGGQLLNAYRWYMTITGDTDLTDNAYVPNYFRASGDLVALLKEAAMSVPVVD